MADLVSIIITTYKRPELLNRSLRSALNQTYHNVEVLVVDDNDNNSDARLKTQQLMQTTFAGYNNLRYLCMAHNSGACVARNRGVDECHGTYIQFLDDDDEMLPEKIEKQVAVFEADKEMKLSAVGCYGEVVDGTGNHVSDIRDDIRGDVFFWNMCDIVGVTSQLLIRKSTYVESGGFEKMHASQDHWMLIRLFSVVPYYDYVSESLVRIYHHSAERISTNSNKPLGAVELYEKCKPLFNRLTSEQVKKVMRIRNENIVDVFMQQNRKKEAFHYWRLGIEERGYTTFHDILRLTMIVMGLPAYNSIIKGLSQIKHAIIGRI